MPIPDGLKGLPLSDMILRAVSDPGSILPRDRLVGRVERMADWRARAVWDVMWECGLDPARTFVSEAAMEAFDRRRNEPEGLRDSLGTACASCGHPRNFHEYSDLICVVKLDAFGFSRCGCAYRSPTADQAASDSGS